MTSMQDALSEALEHPLPEPAKPHGKHRYAKKPPQLARAESTPATQPKVWWIVMLSGFCISGLLLALQRNR